MAPRELGITWYSLFNLVSFFAYLQSQYYNVSASDQSALEARVQVLVLISRISAM